MNAKIFAGAALAAGRLGGFTHDQVVRILSGMMYIFNRKDSLAEMTRCFRDVKAVDADLFKAINDFIERKDATELLDGIAHLGNVLVALPQDMTDCTSMQDDLHRIEAWAEIFTHPAELAGKIWQNLLANYANIIFQLDKFNQWYAEERWGFVGRKIAWILVDVLGPIPETELYDDIDEDPENIPLTQW